MHKNKKYFTGVNILFIALLLIISSTEIIAQKAKHINIINAETLEYDDDLGKNVQRLKGDVQFENSGTLLFCDSAYFYPNNFIEAFGNVHVNKGDSIHLHADSLEFYGEKQIAIARGKVMLSDREMLLTTNQLNFNLATNVSSYYNHGNIINKDNTLNSKIGYYDSDSKTFSFKDSVILSNPEYKMYTDTLQFNTVSEIAYFRGPTRVVSKESIIETEKGWYDTKTDKSELSLNNKLISDGQSIEGDSILYNRKEGLGRAYENVCISDTANRVLIKGEYALYNQKSNRSFVTERATMIQAFDKDSLFLHADSLWVYRDTVENLNEVFAYYKSRFYKSDMQGVCDSLVYIQKDSLIRMYTDPILWSEKNQITGEYMEILIYDGEFKQLNIDKEAFIISEVDSLHFNQIKGRGMVAKFKDNEMNRIYVNGNGQTIYFAQEENKIPKKLIGMNKLDCSNIVVYVENSEIKNMTFLQQPNGVMTPMNKTSPSNMRLDGFEIKSDEKPISKEDIYRRD